jgi:hypothetical protein
MVLGRPTDRPIGFTDVSGHTPVMRGLWTVAFAGLAFGAVSMFGGSAAGGGLGRLVLGYGLLVLLASIYLAAGLAIRDRIWRRLHRPAVDRVRPVDLAGRRIF